MENKLSIIKENLTVAKKAKELYNTIANGQLDELINLLSEEKLSIQSSTDIFKKVFNCPLISKDYLLFCKLLVDNNSLISDYTENINQNNGTVSLLDNVYSRKAVDKFTNHFNISGEFELDFNSVCEAVYSGRSKYALIPLFNTRDGLIISLYKLLQKYDLKIISSARILMNDGNTETEFLLLSRSISFVPIGDERRLLLSVTHSYDNTIADLVSATVSQNITLRSINTLPLEYTDERCESILVFDISSCHPAAISCFLHSALPEASIIGIYSIVK